MDMTGREAPSDLPDAYGRVRATTERLASVLSAEDQTVQTMPDVSPTKWHRAHVTWFFETFILGEYATGYRAFDDAYAYIFNSYYEAVGARHPRPERGLLSRPGIDEIARYRRFVDDAMDALLRDPGQPGLADLITLGLHHEQQHQELLLMDIKHVLSRNPLHPAYLAGAPARRASRPPKAGWIEHGGGPVEIGHRGGGFGFDNEFPVHTVYLTPFGLADRPVTCGEWLSFIEDDGYSRPEFWLSDGWAVVNDAALGRAAVLVARPRRPRPLAPVHAVGLCDPSIRTSRSATSATTRPMRSPTGPACGSRPSRSGRRSPSPTARATTSCATTFSRPVRPTHGRRVSSNGIFGDTWEWTSSAYSPYPGFRAAPGAVGEYNGKFMVSQYVLRGGCCATPAGHVRPTYRNFFPPGARWAFGGLRLARDP